MFQYTLCIITKILEVAHLSFSRGLQTAGDISWGIPSCSVFHMHPRADRKRGGHCCLDLDVKAEPWILNHGQGHKIICLRTAVTEGLKTP